ncbi:PAS-domain containing protein, partial [Porticoccaceae bacterium]|nr:PAS-domain containing protein [Porticoccaceae bacterium]
VGNDRTARFVQQIEQHGEPLALNNEASPTLLKQAERLIASSIGSASARNIIETAIQVSSNQTPSDLMDVLDQTSAAIQFNRGLLQGTLDNISQGVSAIDQDLNLVAWNRTYLDMFAYPKDFIKVGMPISEVIKLNLQRGMVGEESVDKEVSRRLLHMRNGTSYSVERTWQGRVLRFQGNPMPDGGYVTTFTDITGLINTQRQLEQANSNLERLVDERTESLSKANSALKLATREAENATVSKTRFLAAASHDLLQPLNAGKLFIGALQEPGEQPLDERRSQLAKRAMASLQSAESLLRALLDISKLDAGALEPNLSHFNIAEVLAPLGSEFAAIANNNGLQLRMRNRPITVVSDPQLLRSILQNFIANAVRYTQSGTVLVACRKRADHLLVEVRDSGPGIAIDQQQAIFEEFHRLAANNSDKQGLGLGLAITKRIAALLGHPLSLRSKPGAGSTFSVKLPLSDQQQIPVRAAPISSSDRSLRGLKVLCIDDQLDIVEASEALLSSWGVEVVCATRFNQAVEILAGPNEFDLVIADYRLDSGRTGLEILQEHCSPIGSQDKPGGIVISAEQAAEIGDKVEEAGFYFIAKPVDPSQLRTLLGALMRVRQSTR